jgi:FkbM family methyltransferase
MTNGSKLITGGVVFACGLMLWNVRDVGGFAWSKLTSENPCPLPATASRIAAPVRVEAEKLSTSLVLQQSDGELNQFKSPSRPFWIGDGPKGRDVLAFLLSEHKWTEKLHPANAVRPGDVVLDCGAHVGVFVDLSLRRGASKVVAIEPEPNNLECLRRNFANEIAAGTVVIVPYGVWNSKTELHFSNGVDSRMGRTVPGTGDTFSIPVDTIDAIVARLQLPKVSYIKMDIEGSERQALIGARDTLAKYKPRLMISGYHLPDDFPVIPNIVKAINGDYHSLCGPCITEDSRLSPHVIYFN